TWIDQGPSRAIDDQNNESASSSERPINSDDDNGADSSANDAHKDRGGSVRPTRAQIAAGLYRSLSRK
ncbi:MAG: hypothetical protein ACRD3W_19605, partial [Terriglobales bacterium]